VVIVTRADRAEESNTYWAQGGIIFRGEGDSPALLAKDIEHAATGCAMPRPCGCWRRAVPGWCSPSCSIVSRCVRPPARRPARPRREGGHSLPRILHATDATGRAMEDALIAALRAHPRVRFLTSHTAWTCSRRRTTAATGVPSTTRCPASAPTCSTSPRAASTAASPVPPCSRPGGLGQIYLRTTNPVGSRGDGLAMAYRAGARVINTEYVQFPPTAFYHRNAPCFLITEAVRGAGARLVDERGVPFMERYDPEWKDLAPRDVVARSIHSEIFRRGVPNAYLDLRSYIPAERIRAEFRAWSRAALEYGIDITRDLLPVVPAAHYSCGGVWVDDVGRSTVERLYAVGEVSCTGLHGANRLASTSLLEGLVWGYALPGTSRRTALARRPALRRHPPWKPPAPRCPMPRWSRRT